MTQSVDHNSGPAGSYDVGVLGCGNMGSALVRASLAAGRRVIVWNRTTERAEALAGDGAAVTTSVDEALTAAPVAILCVGSTDDVRSVLDEVAPDRLAGRTTILNVTSGTPQDGRAMNDWATTHGISYLDAAIAAYPEQIGHAEARILVAGDAGLWSAHRGVICELAGSSMHVGEDHSAANAIDAALTGAFYISSLVSFIEAARFLDEFDIPKDVLSDFASYAVSVLGGELEKIVSRIAANDFSTDQATLEVYAAASEVFAAGLNERGEAPMIQTTAQTLRRAVDAGLGNQDIGAVFKLQP
jgi:3-hydroxyisobutyrate dehydrogenase-like beta-hydroxyacid dehydrogenase